VKHVTPLFATKCYKFQNVLLVIYYLKLNSCLWHHAVSVRGIDQVIDAFFCINSRPDPHHVWSRGQTSKSNWAEKFAVLGAANGRIAVFGWHGADRVHGTVTKSYNILQGNDSQYEYPLRNGACEAVLEQAQCKKEKAKRAETA
jgi:hypothetical protein